MNVLFAIVATGWVLILIAMVAAMVHDHNDPF